MDHQQIAHLQFARYYQNCKSLLRMKKFLDLKRSIVNSKNQPTIIQTYLQSIRSSCYKIATPKVSPRTRELSTSVTAQNNGSSSTVEQAETPVRALDYPSAFKQMSSDKKSSETLILPKIQKMEQIFSTLSSHCKEMKAAQNASQQQIFKTILKSLDLLAVKQQFKESVVLIRSIVNAMSGAKIEQQNIFSNDWMQSNRDNQIKEYEIKDLQSYREDSHFKSCLKQIGEQQQEICHTLQKQYNKNYAKAQLQWNDDRYVPSVNKYQPCEKLNHQNGSIYIEDPSKSQQSCFDDSEPEATLTERRSTTDLQGEINSMHSQWREQSLQCIQQVEEEDVKSLESSSIIPQQTIEFKKILYMLDSSTAKKQVSVTQIQQNQEPQKICHKFSHHSTKSLFCEKASFLSSESDKSTNEHINQTYCFEPPDNSTQKQSSPSTYVQILHQRQNRRCQNIVAEKRTVKPNLQKQKVKISNISQTNKPDRSTGSTKSKQLNDIVSMLSNKYNRTVKLGANK